MSGNWIAVASAEHVKIGRAGGFMQVCHGKAAPLRRLRPGDRVAYYSPTGIFRGGDTLQAFTALGTVREAVVYQADMGGGFHPFRRDVDWFDAVQAPIRPLLGDLDFTAGARSWGYPFRFGLFSVSEHDMALISGAMGVTTPLPAAGSPERSAA